MVSCLTLCACGVNEVVIGERFNGSGGDTSNGTGASATSTSGGSSAGGASGGTNGAAGATGGIPSGLPTTLPSNITPIGTPTTGIPIDPSAVVGEPGPIPSSLTGLTLRISFQKSVGFFAAPIEASIGPVPSASGGQGTVVYDPTPATFAGKDGSIYVSLVSTDGSWYLANSVGVPALISGAPMTLFMNYSVHAGAAYAVSPTQGGTSGIVYDSTYFTFTLE